MDSTTNLREVERLFAAFGSGAVSVTETQIKEFARQIDGRPHTHVKRVVDKFIDGKIPGQKLDYPPTPAQFGNALLLEPYHGQQEQDWARSRISTQDTIAIAAPETPAPQMSKKTHEGVKQLAAALKTQEEG